MGAVAIFKGKLVKFLAKAGILVPARGDIDRSATPAAGEMAFNTNANKLEVYDGTTWTQLGAGGGDGGGVVSTKTGNYTLQSTDAGSTIVMSNPLASTITVPSGLDPTFNCKVLRTNAPIKVIGSGTTINSITTGSIVNSVQGLAQIQSYSSNTYNISGTVNNVAYGLTINGGVLSQVILGDYAYIAGSFNAITDTSGNTYTRQRIAKINIVSGEVDSAFDVAVGFNNTVYNLIVSGNDVYAVGLFTAYKSVTRQYIAKLNAITGALDTTFDSSTGFNTIATCLALSGNDLYVGGQFTTYKSNARQYIAKLNASTGALDTTFDSSSGFNSQVLTLIISGTDLYVGGAFTSYQTVTRQRIAKLNASTAALDTTFDSASGFGTFVNCMALSGTDLYVGGDFTDYKSISCQYIAKLNITDASLNSVFDTQTGFNESVESIAVSGNAVYAVGLFFTEYKGTACQRIAKINAIDASLNTEFNTTSGFNSQVRSVAVSGDGVYVAGLFTSYKGSSKFNRWGRLDSTFGQIYNNFIVTNGYSFSTNGFVYNHFISGDYIYLVGSFTTVTDKTGVTYNREKIVKINLLTDQVDTTFDSSTGFDNIPQCIFVSGNDVYVGGNISTYKGVTRQRIAKLNATTAALDTTFDSSSGFSGTVHTIYVSGGSVYAGGAFYTYKGFNRWNIAKLNGITADLDTVFDSSNGFDNDINSIIVSGNDLYAAGYPEDYKGTAIAYIAKLNATTAALDTTFDTATGFNDSVNCLELSGTSLYAGGYFTFYKGVASQGIVKIDTTTAARDTSFNSNTGFNDGVYSITITGNDLYAGGQFITYKGISRPRIVKLNATTAELNATFDPSAGFNINSIVQKVSVVGNSLHVSGLFSSYKNITNADKYCVLDTVSANFKNITAV